MSNDKATRELLSRALAWEDAHAGFETAVKDIPAKLRGKVPDGLPHSVWQIVDHLRRTQRDILEFCQNPEYEELEWPADYWPPAPAPPSAAAWTTCIAEYLKDRRELQKLAADTSIDLNARIPHGSGQTYARELMLVADHTSYHVGQLILVRRLLGIWK
jgi:uncharacterized damage-inducible protein DinB